ncbi:MAG: SEC-C metal-binding domain-containing protein [Alphaproteobacteria bacterium]|nr:SEC-C metal-binding domain-containing protein [Alphaproteobacteria bacterium]
MTETQLEALRPERPIEEIVADLAKPGRAVIGVLRECLARGEAAAPVLRDVVALAAVAWPRGDQVILLHRGLYVLASLRDEATCGPLMALLRKYPDEVIELFDHSPFELSRIIGSIFGEDPIRLSALIKGRSFDRTVRGAALVAMSRIVLLGRLPHDWLAWMVKEVDDDGNQEGEEFWHIARLFACSILEPEESEGGSGAGSEDAAADGSDAIRGYDDDATEFETDLKNGAVGGIDDVIRSLGWDTDRGNRKMEDLLSSSSPGRAENPWRHVGRNDPCPCGSGRKAKKCCWDSRDG